MVRLLPLRRLKLAFAGLHQPWIDAYRAIAGLIFISGSSVCLCSAKSALASGCGFGIEH
jgi:hypothetical protein